jgi:mono/diheme cytochrome c family protein
MTIQLLTAAVLTTFALLTQTATAASSTPSSSGDSNLVARGKYLVKISGCNDCHTPGYMPADGQVPLRLWLTGSAVGFQGAWGTTYPTNLRLTMNAMNEAEWLVRARQPMRPPMPWFNLHDMTDHDLLAIYRFVRSLGPAGEPTPVAVAPGERVDTPYFEFMPKNLPAPAQQARR